MVTLTRQQIDDITKKLVDEGKLIEAGWMGLRIMLVPKDAPEYQVTSMREAFFLGAQHVFSSITNILEEGTEPTANDLKRMTFIHEELEEFNNDFKLRYAKPKGTA